MSYSFWLCREPFTAPEIFNPYFLTITTLTKPYQFWPPLLLSVESWDLFWLRSAQHESLSLIQASSIPFSHLFLALPRDHSFQALIPNHNPGKPTHAIHMTQLFQLMILTCSVNLLARPGFPLCKDMSYKSLCFSAKRLFSWVINPSSWCRV